MVPLNPRRFKGTICHWSLANSHMSLFQKRNTLHRRRLGKGLQERVKIGCLLVTDHFGRVGRHLARWFSDVRNKPRVGDRVLIEPGSCGGRALTFTAVTLIAAEFHKQGLPILGITTWSICRRGRIL